MAKEQSLDVEELETRIGHSFRDRQLIKRALTHVSALKSTSARVDSYQRLEFLGDRVLGLAVSEMLFANFPKAEEGELSRRLADLVRKETCADVAADWGAGPYVRFGGGESLTGATKVTTILGDICESIIGAVFLDGGFDAARALVQREWGDRMRTPKRPLRDSKTALQEWAQARGLAAPLYAETCRAGPAHAPIFTVSVKVDGFPAAEAEGASKRVAEQAAAQAFLEREGLREPRRPRVTTREGETLA